jgi:uncharacterized protein DUF3306
MRGDESFLTRWSRRKRNVAAQADAEKNPPPSAAEIAKTVSPTTGGTPTPIPLPPIGSIASGSDITAFLAPGVPLELTRAALRRAWTTDPAIRDFIGLSENAWDFNAPDGVPGFGSLDLQDVRRLLAQVLDEPQASDPTPVTAALANHAATPAEAATAVHVAEAPGNISAAQHAGENDKRKAGEARPRRHHGGALPQ